MTPEERASKAMKAWMDDDNLSLAPVSVTLMHIASAIREAENEALERARKEVARPLDSCIRGGKNCDKCETVRFAVIQIERLKHPEER